MKKIQNFLLLLFISVLPNLAFAQAAPYVDWTPDQSDANKIHVWMSDAVHYTSQITSFTINADPGVLINGQSGPVTLNAGYGWVTISSDNYTSGYYNIVANYGSVSSSAVYNYFVPSDGQQDLDVTVTPNYSGGFVATVGPTSSNPINYYVWSIGGSQVAVTTTNVFDTGGSSYPGQTQIWVYGVTDYGRTQNGFAYLP